MTVQNRAGTAELTVWIVALLLLLAQVGQDLAQALQVWLG